jgi:probable HAF family extracellular repeat protein
VIAFLYDPTTRTMVDLQTAGGTESHAYGVSSAGQVVGYWVSNNAGHAFLYTRDKGMVDLTTLLAPGSGSWVLQSAQAINDVGQITGYGKNPDGATHAFLLSPVH